MTGYDALVIGTGQAGPPLAKRLAGAGMKVAIVERGAFGGTCLNTGCTPTKTMIASAYAAHVAHRAADFGVVVQGAVTVDMRRVKARKDAIVREWTAATEASLRKTANCAVYQGHARFRSAREVEVGADLLSAERIFINVGGRASVPPIPGLDQVPYLTNSSILDLDELPEHLVIVGGSYVGLEFAQMFSRFGSQVTILEAGERLIAREDAEVSAAIREVLEGEGIEVRVGVGNLSVAPRGDGFALTFDSPSGAGALDGSHLLIAVGRRPNTDDLDLDQAGVATDSRGYIEVDDQLRTNVPGIWALGDCNGHGAFTHTSYNDFEIVAANLLDNDSRRLSDRVPAYALYTDPPLGRAGITEAEARRAGKKVLVGRMAMADVARAIEKGETAGLMKLVVDGDTKQILGAAIMGPGGDEAIHCIIDLMTAKAPVTVLQRAMHIHPTVAELLPTIAGELAP
ncbi:MAG: FAD-containing oxidoreductase [Alphaproteobacteria bacterium]|nr:FAD-containing oxidoreductase [Alphaproteobacteria bacterium]